MHVCCIGKFNIPVFTRKIHLPFNSYKGKSEGEKLLTLEQLSIKARRLVEKSFPRVD